MVWAVVILAAGFPIAAHSGEGDVSVESHLDKSHVTVGELVQYEITVQHLPEIEVTMPPPGINLGGFEIRDYQESDPVLTGKLVTRKVDYTIASYDTGSFVIPPTGIVYMTPDSVRNIMLTDAIPITVESVLTGDTKDVRDIKGPLDLARDWRRILLLSLIGLGVVLLGAAGYYFYRKKKTGKPLFEWKKEPDIPAHEEAFAALNELRDSPLLAEGRVKEYYDRLSEIVRRYLQKRFFKPFMEKTTSQTLEILAEENPGEISTGDTVLPALGYLLGTCDLVKFAKFLPGQSEHEKIWEKAYHIVDSTKIVAVAPGPEESHRNDGGGEYGNESVDETEDAPAGQRETGERKKGETV